MLVLPRLAMTLEDITVLNVHPDQTNVTFIFNYYFCLDYPPAVKVEVRMPSTDHVETRC